MNVNAWLGLHVERRAASFCSKRVSKFIPVQSTPPAARLLRHSLPRRRPEKPSSGPDHTDRPIAPEIHNRILDDVWDRERKSNALYRRCPSEKRRCLIRSLSYMNSEATPGNWTDAPSPWQIGRAGGLPKRPSTNVARTSHNWFRNLRSQNPHPLAKSARRVGHPFDEF